MKQEDHDDPRSLTYITYHQCFEKIFKKNSNTTIVTLILIKWR